MDKPQHPEDSSPEGAGDTENLKNVEATNPEGEHQSATGMPGEVASQAPVAPATNSETSQNNTGTKPRSYKQFAGVIVAIIIVLLVGGYLYVTNKNKEANLVTQSPGTDTSAAELLGIQKKDPVAKVNGKDVSWNDYERSLEQVVQSAKTAGVNLQDPTMQSRIKDQALTTIVNTELLLQEASSKGITASDTAIQTQYDSIQQQVGGQDKLGQMLKQLNLTEADLKKSISDQLVINKYVTGAVDLSSINITEAEIQDQYNKLAASSTGTSTPSLSDVHDAIKSQLQSQKQQQLISALIDSLKQKATIETLL
jgi:hypothetical protein